MRTIDELANTLSREKLSCNALQNKELQEGISSNIEYDGIMSIAQGGIMMYTYSREKGVINMCDDQGLAA